MKRVAIVLFDQVELLDFAGPLETFSVADRRAEEMGGERILDVFTVAVDGRALRTRDGLRVEADHVRDEVSGCDWLLVPGGNGVRPLLRRPEVLNWLIALGEGAERVLSVCTGALLLGACGFLQGRRATTHYLCLDDLRAISPATRVLDDERVVPDGRFVTAAGVSAGLDMSLWVLGQAFDDDLMRRTAAHIEYPLTGVRAPG